MNTNVQGYACVAFAMLLWASNAVVGRAAPDADIPPIALNFWRWTTAFVILIPFAAGHFWSQREMLAKHWRLCVIYGLMAVTLFNTFFYVGLQYTTAVQGSLISATMPVLVLLGARVFLKQPITSRQLFGVSVSIIGVIVIVGRGDLSILTELRPNIGDVWILGGVCAWAGQTILIRMLPREINLMGFQLVAFGVGALMILPLYLYETAGGRSMPVTGTSVLYVGYVAVAASLLAITLYNMAIRRIGPRVAGYMGNLFPVFGAALGILILGEAFEWFHALGVVVILAGIYLATVATTGATPAPPETSKG